MRSTVCFCHGRESGPWGTKIRRLARIAEQFGCRVVSPDDRTTRDPDDRVRRLLEMADTFTRPLVLVGSSMGGYVAAVASEQLQPVGLFLMAPAIGLPGYGTPFPPAVAARTCIVHGWEDAIVPPAKVIDYARVHRATLHLLADVHDLHASLGPLDRLFRHFLDDCLGRPQPPRLSRELLAAL